MQGIPKTARQALPTCNSRAPFRPCSAAVPGVRNGRGRPQAQKGPAVDAPARAEQEPGLTRQLSDAAGLGDMLGPIGLTYSGDVKVDRPEVPKPAKKAPSKQKAAAVANASALMSSRGVELGPIGLTIGPGPEGDSNEEEVEGSPAPPPPSIATMTTAEWRAKYEKDGTVDLWVEEEFNAGSRLVGGRDVHLGGVYGYQTGEGPSSGQVATHRVKIFNHYTDSVVEVDVPEDRYILWEAEDAGLQLPYACRMGCCTACAVRIKEGEMYQPQSLGVSAELREQGYGLMCVGFPSSDLVLETVPEDEVYELQFGKSFAQSALNPSDLERIERDDFALSIANMDE